MTDIVSTRQAHAYPELPSQVLDALEGNQAAANIIYPFARKAKSFPETQLNQLWVVLFDNANNVEFVLSCTEGPLGKYPIFIVVSKSVAKRIKEEGGDEMLSDAVAALILCLLDKVSPRRVFSVFSIANVTHAFAKLFVTAAHARQAHDVEVDSVYYDATFTFCTSETYNISKTFTQANEDLTITLRRADESHIEALALLCQAFSETSLPYKLDAERARLEAETMIRDRQVWVHLVQKGNASPEVACMVATTRESDEVMAITKVFTPEPWRGRRCAGRLLQRVCREALEAKKRVVLYVGTDMGPARKLYGEIGFQGLLVNGSAGQTHIEGVENWVEIGFKGTELGHW